MAYKGIDLSTYQRNVNYMSLKADGLDFAIIRSGFGKNESQKDDMFENHYAGLKYVGIPIGVYHYSYVNSIENAIVEAKNCLKFLNGKQLKLPVFYDLEEKLIKAFGKKKITEFAIAFCTEIEKAGYKAGVYANLDWFLNYIDVKQLIDNGFKIWLAQWNEKPTATFPINYWQYTSKGQVHGIQGNVDLDIAYDDISKTVNTVENFVEKSKYQVRKNLSNSS